MSSQNAGGHDEMATAFLELMMGALTGHGAIRRWVAGTPSTIVLPTLVAR